MNLKGYIQSYCRANLLEPPLDETDYLKYAKRLRAVGIIDQDEYEAFVEEVINTNIGLSL